MEGYLYKPQEQDCGYFSEKVAAMEGAVLRGWDIQTLDSLLQRGVRHFGDNFFRPNCRNCGLCLPLRVLVKSFKFSKNHRRVLSKGRNFNYRLEEPVCSDEAWKLYEKHKKRFDLSEEIEGFDLFSATFFSSSPGHRVVTLRDEGTLILCSHIDILPNGISAVYCYYDTDYEKFSPGTLAILLEIELALEMGLEYLYLGYWIPGHRHMDYKMRFSPNQLLLGGDCWYNYSGSFNELEIPLEFHPEIELTEYFN